MVFNKVGFRVSSYYEVEREVDLYLKCGPVGGDL